MDELVNTLETKLTIDLQRVESNAAQRAQALFADERKRIDSDRATESSARETVSVYHFVCFSCCCDVC
jgi:hypothetical protein